MRGLKSTFLLVGVLVALVAYIYFVDSRQSDDDEREKVYATAAADAIEEVQIKSEDGERTTVRKANDTWTIAEPLSTEADATELSLLTSAISDVAIERVVDEKPADLKPFGLDPPRIEVSYRLKDDKTTRALFIGDKTPTGGNLYAKTPDNPRVFLLASTLESTLNKNTFALRDKRILKFERDKIDTIELVSGSSTIQLAKSGTEWKLVKPLSSRADFGIVETLLERLGSAQMQAITSSDATDLKQYGLDRPTGTIALGAGSTRATLLVGRTDEAAVYAKDASRPLVFTIPSTAKDDMFKDVTLLRRKDLFDSRAFTANRVEITRGTETVAFEKSKGKDDQDVWTKAGGADVDSAKVEELLGRLLFLRADTFETAASPALKSPALTVTVAFDDKKRTETIRFGRSGTDVHAVRADEPGAGVLPAKAFDDALASLDAVK